VRAALVLVVLLTAAIADACEPAITVTPRGRVEASGVVLSFGTTPSAIVVGRHFSVEVFVCADQGPVTLQRVDATMPEHRHGMNYRPTLASPAVNHYVAEGFLFHMPGTWQLVFDVEQQGRRVRLTSDVLVE
jgi:hypothetical protein